MPLTAHPFNDIAVAITNRPTARRELNFGSSTWTHVISIGDPGARLAVSRRRLGDRLLRLEFDDVNPAAGTTPESIRAGLGYIAARPEHIQAIAAFGRTLPAGARLLVHCEQGRSRSSAAVAIVLMARYGLTETEALRAVTAFKSDVTPNTWMLGLYSEISPDDKASP